MKNNTITKVLSIVLALTAVFCMAVPSFAADITANGGNGTTPVNLSSTADGTLGGDPAATALSVTLPTAFPLAMGTDGTVTTADNCRIVNNSYGAVRVKSATINGANGWSLTAFGDKAICNAAIDPFASTELRVASARTIDYRTKVTITATATNVPEGCHLAMMVNGKEYITGSDCSVSYEVGELKNDITYSAFIVDADGVVQKNSDNMALMKEGGKITCKSGFIQKLIAFFSGLFNALPKVEVKP